MVNCVIFICFITSPDLLMMSVYRGKGMVADVQKSGKKNLRHKGSLVPSGADNLNSMVDKRPDHLSNALPEAETDKWAMFSSYQSMNYRFSPYENPLRAGSLMNASSSGWLVTFMFLASYSMRVLNLCARTPVRAISTNWVA